MVNELATSLNINKDDKVIVRFTSTLTQLIYLLAISKVGGVCIFVSTDTSCNLIK